MLRRIPTGGTASRFLRVRRYDLAQDRYETDELYGAIASAQATDAEAVGESAGGPSIDAVIT
jgi:hypothetical protein